MAKTVRDTIKEITRKHLTEKKGKCYGQCLTAVGVSPGKIPEDARHTSRQLFPIGNV